MGNSYEFVFLLFSINLRNILSHMYVAAYNPEGISLYFLLFSFSPRENEWFSSSLENEKRAFLAMVACEKFIVMGEAGVVILKNCKLKIFFMCVGLWERVEF